MRTRQKRVATDTWRSLGCRTTPLEHWSKRKPTVEPRSDSNTLCVFKEILSDLDEVRQSGEERTSNDIICHIKATMSDRAATEVKFNSLLEEYRKEILPLVYYNYQTFSEGERTVLKNMSNFFVDSMLL